MPSISSLGVGSGLDLSGLLDQLESAERQKLTPIVAQQKTAQAKISSFGLLESALSQFQSAATKLNDVDYFSTMKSTVTGDAGTAVANAEAMPGSYQIDVTQQARGYSIATGGVSERSDSLGEGTITLTLDNGDSSVIDIAAGSSLEDIRDAINDADSGVAASIVNDGSAAPYRLVLSSRDTGTESAITAVDFGTLGGTLALDPATEVSARNAELKVNGIDIESQSNTVEGAIQGVTLALEEAGEMTLEIRRDDSAIKNAVNGFVNGYNALQKVVDNLTSYNSETGSAGTLLGNNALRSVESRMRDAMSNAVAGGDIELLGDVGIALQLDGTLSMDEDAFTEVLSENPDALADFFAGAEEADGFAGHIDSVISSMTETGGLLDNATSGLSASVDALGLRYERMEQSIAATISRYRSQFSKLDGMIASMNSTSDYLTQQFDMMNAQLGRN